MTDTPNDSAPKTDAAATPNATGGDVQKQRDSSIEKPDGQTKPADAQALFRRRRVIVRVVAVLAMSVVRQVFRAHGDTHLLALVSISASDWVANTTEAFFFRSVLSE